MKHILPIFPTRTLLLIPAFLAVTVLMAVGFASTVRASVAGVYSDEAKWLAQLGTGMHDYAGTSTETDVTWQCGSPGGECFNFTESTVTLQPTLGLGGGGLIRFDPSAPTGYCGPTPSGCQGIISETFSLSQPVYAIGATISVYPVTDRSPAFSFVSFDGVPIPNVFADVFVGVISDAPFTSSYSIECEACVAFDEPVDAAFNIVGVATTPINEPSSRSIFLTGLIAALSIAYRPRRAASSVLANCDAS
jgi:hypothetical protein